jgi:hypothetical protein
MLQKPPSISPGLTRRKLDLLSESITSDKSTINSTQLEKEEITKESISIEKLYTNQCSQTDFDSVAKNTNLDTSKKVFKPITKPVVKSLAPDCSQRKKIPVLVPKPVKVLKSKDDEKDKPRTDLLKKQSTSTPRLTKPTINNTKAIESIKKNPSTPISKENKEKCNENKNVTEDLEKLHNLNNTTHNCIDHSNNEEENMSQKLNLVKSKRKSIDSVNMVHNVTEKIEKLTRSKTSIDLKAPKMSKRGIVKGNDGWETVIRSRRSNPLTQSSSNIKLKSSFDIKKRFQVPSSASSMPALAVITSNPEEPKPKNILPDKNDRPIISNAVEFPKKKCKPDKPPVQKNKIIDQMRKEMLKDKIEEQRICDEELLRNRQFFDEEMMLAREIRELENAESSCSDDMTQSDRYSDLLDNMILTERMYTINEIKALIQYGNESAIDSIAMPSWDICRSTESIKQTYSARQAKAHQKRQQLLQDKSTKVRELLKKVIFIIYKIKKKKLL